MSRSQSPDRGISAGITSAWLVALTEGANTGLKNSPVKFVRKNNEIIAKGANFAKRKWGKFRENIISLILHVSDDAGSSD
ncbi:MAG: hypothetical protein ABR501_03310 [Pyrinomonadaceae bacterium]